MTVIYRTPNQIIDNHEWHAAVTLRCGRVALVYRFRPLSLREVAWQSVSAWRGPKPKGMCNVFWRFRGHIREAMASEQTRLDALSRPRKALTGAQVRNPGRHALAIASA